MKRWIFLFSCLSIFCIAQGQKPGIPEIKKALEKSPNSPLYVKDVLKKQFVLDTVTVMNTSTFRGLADSIAYHGKVKQVFGPYTSEKGRILLQVLAKLPNSFNHVGQIFLDTSMLTKKVADSIADQIIANINSGKTSFAEMAVAWSMGGEAATKGDLGWIARGSMIPAIEQGLIIRPPGSIFKVWTPNGLHIIQKMDEMKEDTGYALIMRIFL